MEKARRLNGSGVDVMKLTKQRTEKFKSKLVYKPKMIRK